MFKQKTPLTPVLCTAKVEFNKFILLSFCSVITNYRAGNAISFKFYKFVFALIFLYYGEHVI